MRTKKGLRPGRALANAGLALLALLACAGAAAMPPFKPASEPQRLTIALGDAEMARLRAAIALPRPDALLTVTGVYANGGPAGGAPGAQWASFQIDGFDTGPGHRRHRLGSCQRAPGAQWTCSYHERLTRVIDDMTVTARLPTDMPTELAIRILDFAVPLINVGIRSEREFSVSEHGDQISVSFGKGCITSMKLRRQGDTFEKVPQQLFPLPDVCF